MGVFFVPTKKPTIFAWWAFVFHDSQMLKWGHTIGCRGANNMPKDIVIQIELRKGEPRLDSRIAAEGFDRKNHTDFRRHILEKFESQISELGVVLKTTLETGEIVWYLNEPQLNFVGSLCRNNERTVAFKLRLAKELELAKRLLSQRHNQAWIEARESGKIERRVETDTIKVFVDYAHRQGSKNAGKYYQSLSTMENRALFFVEQKYPNLRDVLGTDQLNTVQTADRIVSKALQDGMDQELHYKDIYKLAKSRILGYADLVGRSSVPCGLVAIAG